MTAKSNLNDLDGACADWNKAVATAGDDEGAKKTYQAKIDENCITKEKAIKELKELKEGRLESPRCIRERCFLILPFLSCSSLFSPFIFHQF